MSNYDFTSYNDGLRKTVILEKDNMIGLLALNLENPTGGAVYRYDPRKDFPEVGIYETEIIAENTFAKSLRSSFENGWKVLYNGLPNFG